MELGDRLMRFARMRYGPRWLVDTLDEEGLLDSDGVVPDSEMPIVIPWLLHFRTNAEGLTLGEEWRRDQDRKATADDRLLLDAYGSAWVSLWEVAEVQPGVGSRLSDLLTREERFVHDVRSSSTLKRFDALLGIVLTSDGVSFFGGLHTQALPPREAEAAVDEARRMCGVETGTVSTDLLRDREVQLALLALWSEAVQDMYDRPPPALQNTDGDPLSLTSDDFALLAPRPEVEERLAGLPGVEEPEQDGNETVFTVVKGGNPVHRSWDNTVIARIALSDARMKVETNSTRRADSLRSSIEKELGGLVRFRLRREDNPSQLIESARVSGGPRSAGAGAALPPEALAMVRQIREQHLRDWIDDSLPALDGLTPRQAARLPRARPKLETLLKEFEQNEARLSEQERIDHSWVWEELGFPRVE